MLLADTLGSLPFISAATTLDSSRLIVPAGMGRPPTPAPAAALAVAKAGPPAAGADVAAAAAAAVMSSFAEMCQRPYSLARRAAREVLPGAARVVV